MKKKNYKWIIIFSMLLVLLTSAVLVFANQENEYEIPHDHEYSIVSFHDDIAVFQCDICDDTLEICFSDHLNQYDYPLLDLNGDGIVNAKDYALLIQRFKS